MTPSGALVISLDFELNWGVRDIYRNIGEYRDNLLGVRRSVPGMLGLFSELDVHATWATVGLLFCESKREMLATVPARKPRYLHDRLSPYGALDAVGDDERDDPYHFALSLIRRIDETPGQEIATHTFSHYYCLEAGQSPAEFREDLEAAVEVARRKLGRAPESIVFARNQFSAAYLDVCAELGLLAYRGNLDRWMYRARRYEDESQVRRAARLADCYVPLTGTNSVDWEAGASKPANVSASRYLRPYSQRLRHLDRLRLARIRADLRHAARRGRLYHLWWHPHDFGVHLRENLAFLRRILDCFAELRETYGMESLTMAEAARRTLGVGSGSDEIVLEVGPAAEAAEPLRHAVGAAGSRREHDR